jgi:hypothetical protein
MNFKTALISSIVILGVLLCTVSGQIYDDSLSRVGKRGRYDYSDLGLTSSEEDFKSHLIKRDDQRQLSNQERKILTAKVNNLIKLLNQKKAM